MLSRRAFSASAIRTTDGVYAELTSMRVKTPWIEALRKKQEEGYDPTRKSNKPETPPDRDLSPKSMADSYHRVVLPLARDKWLGDNYLNSNGHIRLGTIFMDLDALSGVIAYRHTGEAVMTVTAAVDRITIKHPLEEICDLELSGQVSFATGRSSMEISMQVAKVSSDGSEPKEEDVLVTCAFTMVSLDPGTKKPVAVAPLRIDTPEEQRLYDLGKKNYEAKKSLNKTTLRKVTPNDEESDLIHDMWLKQMDFNNPNTSLTKPSDTVYMDKTRIHSTQIMQPQYRNRHNFMVFGGYLLKQTFELAFSCAASFSHTRPTFVSLDPSTFDNPVPVGSVLYLTATVAYTDEAPESSAKSVTVGSRRFTRVQIRVDSRVRSIEHSETKPTGQFNYTFLVEKDISVMPKTYTEMMMYLDARRRAQRINASSEGQRDAHQDNDKRERLME
jgi:acyl-coenzyme A thioesterase 9